MARSRHDSGHDPRHDDERDRQIPARRQGVKRTVVMLAVTAAVIYGAFIASGVIGR